MKLIDNNKNREAWRVNGILRKCYVKCGKLNCSCSKGRLHGWYWYLYWREGSRLRCRYIKRKDLDVVRTAIKRGHLWAEKVRDNVKQQKMNLLSAISVSNDIWNGRIYDHFLMKWSAKTLADGLKATKLISSGRWYLIWPDYRLQLVALKHIDWLKFGLF